MWTPPTTLSFSDPFPDRMARTMMRVTAKVTRNDAVHSSSGSFPASTMSFCHQSLMPPPPVSERRTYPGSGDLAAPPPHAPRPGGAALLESAVMRRLRLLLLALFAIAMVASACSSDSDDSSPDTTTSVSTTEATTSSSGVTTTSTGATSTTAGGPTACATNQLHAELGPSNAGAGQIYVPLILRNTSSTTCEVRGFPGVSLLDGSGNQIGQPATRDGGEGAAVSLAPGQAASATLHTTSAGIGPSCDPASTQMKVFPPNQTAEITFAAQYTACGGFSVTTLVAGEAGTA